MHFTIFRLKVLDCGLSLELAALLVIAFDLNKVMNNFILRCQLAKDRT